MRDRHKEQILTIGRHLGHPLLSGWATAYGPCGRLITCFSQVKQGRRAEPDLGFTAAGGSFFLRPEREAAGFGDVAFTVRVWFLNLELAAEQGLEGLRGRSARHPRRVRSPQAAE